MQALEESFSKLEQEYSSVAYTPLPASEDKLSKIKDAILVSHLIFSIAQTKIICFMTLQKCARELESLKNKLDATVDENGNQWHLQERYMQLNKR